MRDVFLPALLRVPVVGKDARKCWMNPKYWDPADFWPNALVSYPYWKDSNRRHWPEGGYLFGDSGGYSVMTQGITLDARDVLRWQMRTCDVGVILDTPPVDAQGNRIFDQALGLTVSAVQAAQSDYLKHLADAGECRWWGVIHGWTYRDLQKWYDGIRSAYPFEHEGEGWAVKPRPSITPETTAFTLHFLQQQGIKRTHFLMTTGPTSVAVMLALGPAAGLDFCSYDAAGAFVAGLKFDVMVPNDNGYTYDMWTMKAKSDAKRLRPYHKQRPRKETMQYLLEGCPCQSCLQMRLEQDEPYAQSNGYWQYRLCFHNVLTQIFNFTNMRAMAGRNPDHLLRTVLKDDYGTVMRAFEGKEPDHAPWSSKRGLLDEL